MSCKACKSNENISCKPCVEFLVFPLRSKLLNLQQENNSKKLILEELLKSLPQPKLSYLKSIQTLKAAQSTLIESKVYKSPNF